ncbi:aminoglycoside 6'-acetyltransferase [Devosia riboflavina]|uniref:Aminoglycoside N(6')-acetyltransferase type 1 n=1 Tax=Devosia riboflavina TaxID=46914 RepID=A0A087M2D0_9HYPH|nr:aminoglycoside 6'-acetyltransferase [Devosia riboflavina]
MDCADHLGQPVKIALATAADAADWVAMRTALWPSGGDGAHAADIAELLDDAGETINLIARDADGAALGFVEAALRHDYVNGCKTSPVAFLEGIFVKPEARGRGVARAMVGAVEAWAREQGCTEFASDAALENFVSHDMHRALGFAETQRVAFFRKVLG